MTESSGLFPWHESLFQRLVSRHISGQLPHALLFCGPTGAGKFELATTFIQSLLSEVVDTSEKALNLLNAGTHPDLFFIEPLADKKTISVDQIREVTQKLSLTPQISQKKIALIRLAEHMTTAAANALLKTLEEPAGDALLILISHNPGRLPQTIRSRCQHISIPLPDSDTAKAWLNQHSQSQQDELLLDLVDKSPYRALQYIEDERLKDFSRLQTDLGEIFQGRQDILQASVTWKDYDMEILFSWLLKLTHALTQHCMVGSQTLASSANLLKNLKISPDTIDLKKLLEIYDSLRKAQVEHDANLNRELVLEQLFLRWSLLRSA